VPDPNLSFESNETLLLRTEDGGDLHRMDWDDGRLTYPRPLGLAGDAADRMILGLGRWQQTTWAVQKVGDDLRLYRWTADGDAREPSVFSGAAGKAERAVWLGGERLLVADKFAKGVRRVEQIDGQVIDREPSHLSRVSLDEFVLMVGEDGLPQAARMTDGVLQWLDEDLHAMDQMMLPEGRRLADVVMLDDGRAWALQQGGSLIHEMLPDDAGVLRQGEMVRIEGGRGLLMTPGLGLILQTGDGVMKLSEGRPPQLEVAQSLDARDGRPAGNRDATVHRIMSLDIDGDGRDDALLTDDQRHQLTALRSGKDGSSNSPGHLSPLISWPVFEDSSYPYGGTADQQVREPRAMVALDLDGDGGQDLALLSHDRLLFYLAHAPKPLEAEESE
jgi:hypothetical protein